MILNQMAYDIYLLSFDLKNESNQADLKAEFFKSKWHMI